MQKRIYITILFIINLLQFDVYSQSSAKQFFEEKLPGKLLLEDLDKLIALHKKYDPSFYFFASELKIDSTVKEFKNALNQPMTRLEFMRMVKPLIVALGERHNAIFYEMDYYKDYFVPMVGKELPFNISYINNAYYIHTINSTIGIPEKSELKSINSHSIEEIDFIFRKSFLRDGHIKAPIGLKINEYGHFWRNYIKWVADTNDLKSIVMVGYSAPGSSEVVKKKIELIEIIEKNKSTVTSKPYSFKMVNDSIAKMQISSFDDRGQWNKEDFYVFFEESFKQLNKTNTPYLIIDVRNNTGGNDNIPIDLVKFLTNEKFIVSSQDEIVSKKRVRYNNQKKPTNIGKGFKKKKGKWHSFNVSVAINDKIEKDLVYKGELILLINEDTYSATTWLASYVKENKLGAVIGRETTGHCGGSTSSYGNIFELPNTGLKHHIGFMRADYPHENQSFGKGVMPDIEVEYTFDEVINGKDIILGKAISEVLKD